MILWKEKKYFFPLNLWNCNILLSFSKHIVPYIIKFSLQT